MSDTEMFKTTLMGGYDKDEVMDHIRKLKDNHAGEMARLTKEIQKRDAKLEELTRRLKLREEQRNKLQNEIENKYQKYIDHYDSISSLVVESQIHADEILKEAEVKSEQIIANARAEAKAEIDQIQSRVDDRMEDGRERYKFIQTELLGLVNLVSQVQRKCITSHKEIQQVISQMPESLRDLEETAAEEVKEMEDRWEPEAAAAAEAAALAEAEAAEQMEETEEMAAEETAEAAPQTEEVQEEKLVLDEKEEMQEIERKVRKDLELEEGYDEADDLTDEDIDKFLDKHGIVRAKK